MKQFKRWILILIILALAAGLSACRNNQSQNQEEVRLIVESMLAKGEYGQAAQKAEGLEENDYSRPLAAYCRACDAGEQGNYDTAVTTLKELGDYRDSRNMATYYEARKLEAEADSGTKPVENRIAAAQAYQKLPEFRDSDTRADACMQAAYDYAVSLSEQKKFDEAKEAFGLLGSYLDSPDMARKTEADALYEAGDRKGAFEIYSALGPKYQTHAAELMNQYSEAGALKKQGKYEEAALAYETLGDYMDSVMQVTDCRYLQAGQLLAEKKYEEAETIYASLGDYQDSLAQISECRYRKAETLLAEGKTAEAQAIFTELGDYRDSADYLTGEQYRQAVELAQSGKYQEAIAIFDTIADYKDSRFLAAQAAADELYNSGDLAGAWTKYRDLDPAYQTHRLDYRNLLAAAEEAREAGRYDEAEKQYLALGTYEDANQKAVQCRYEKAADLLEKKRFDEAEAVFSGLDNYQDSAEMVLECRYRKAAALMDSGRFEEAEALFESLEGYKDSQEYIDRMKGDILFSKGDLAGAWEYYRNLDESLQTQKGTYEDFYATAGELRANGQYDEARKQYLILGDYRDSAALALQCLTDKGDAYMADHYYAEALKVYEELKDPEKINECHYQYGIYLRENKRYAHAVKQFTLCRGYKDSEDQIARTGLLASEDGDLAQAFAILRDREQTDETREAVYQTAAAAVEQKDYQLAITIYEWLGSYKDSVLEMAKCRNLLGMALYEQGEYDQSIEVFSAMGEDFNASDKVNMARYAKAKQQMETGKYAEAMTVFQELGDYEDSRELLNACRYEYGAELYRQDRLQEAMDLLAELPEEGYPEAGQMLTDSRYQLGLAAEQAGDYGRAAALLELCGDYLDSRAHLLESGYRYAVRLKEASDVDGATEWFVRTRSHEGVPEQMEEVAAFCDTMGMTQEAEHVRQTALWIRAENAMDAGQYGEAASLYAQVTDPDLQKDREKQAYSLYGDELLNEGKYAEAREAFAKAAENEKIMQAWDREGDALLAAGQYAEAQKAFTEAGNRNRYEDAVFGEAKALLEAGDARASYERLQEIADREDVKEFIRTNHAFSALRVKAGQILTLGAFEQDNDPENGKEPIEWLVLATEEDKALVISRYALDCRPYNRNSAHITWADCTLRQWLNEGFLTEAFTEEQQAAILTTQVDNSTAQGNPAWKVTGGKNTEDRIFLLSYQEADLYFAGAEARMCAPTDYAKARGAYTKETNQTDGRACGWWWLRSPGHSGTNAARIGTDGNRSNDKVSHDNICVRPAMWVDLDAGVF